jgi:cell cycle checkpoint control protein RAD9A
MAILSFTLNPDSISKLHDALVCLGKFSEAVSIEASNDKVCFLGRLLYIKY